MDIDVKITQALSDLIKIGDEISAGRVRTAHGGEYRGRTIVNVSDSCEWGISSLNLIRRLFNEQSEHYLEFKGLFQDIVFSSTFDKALGILKGANFDYQNGYLFNTQALIEAEIFDDFLEQAEELLKKGYFQPAAVIAGSVLEDGLRKLCVNKSLTLPAKSTIDPINTELAKAGVYNKLTQKKITALADLRNKAAHGEWTEFAKRDVEDMIRDVRRFMEEYFR